MLSRPSHAAAPAVLALIAVLATACGERAVHPECLPNPTLRCVTDQAVAALDAATSAEPLRNFLSLDPTGIGLVAEAQQKLGDTAGLARTVRLMRQVANPGFGRIALAQFLARFGDIEEARQILLQIAKDNEKAWSADVTTYSYNLLTSFIALLLDAGLKDEATALLARTRASFDPGLERMSDTSRLLYFADIVRASDRVGDREAAAAVAAKAWAAVRARPANPSDSEQGIGDRIELATALLDAGLVTPTGEVLAEARALAERPDPDGYESRRIRRRGQVLRLAYRLAAAAKDAAAQSVAREAMGKLRADVAQSDPDLAANELLHADFKMLMAAGDREAALAIRAEAAALLDRLRPMKDASEGAFDRLAEIYAALGDEAGYKAALGRVPDDGHDWKVPSMIKEKCVIMAKNGHIEAALRCAARLGDSRPFAPFRRLDAYANIAAAMARQ